MTGESSTTGDDPSTTFGPPTTTTTLPTTTDPATTEPGTTEDDGTATDDTTDPPPPCVDLVPQALTILEANCAKCHGPGSAGLGAMDYILDPDALIQNGKIVVGEPEQSRIYIRMTAAENPMPPAAEEQRPSEDDIEVIHTWISECLATPSCGDSPLVTTDEVLTMIAHDLDGATVPVEAFPFTRYLSLVHLANAGFCDAEIEVYRQALAKLVNSLSQETQVKAPVAIDDRRLVYRIDIRDYAWDGEPVKLSAPSFYFSDGDDSTINPAEQLELDKVFADRWEMIADQNPYSRAHLGDQADLISADTGTKFPILQADAFIDVTTRAPLYYDILGIPTRSGRLRDSDPPCVADDCLESQLGLDFLGDIASELVDNADVTARAGFFNSDISDFNRVIERHLFPNANNRALWIAYDFAAQDGDANIAAHPLDFQHDASALLFNLPNGFQGYMLADEDGGRIDEGFLNIIQDESQKDFIVRAGISCIGCHSSGLIRVKDDIRFDLDNGQLREPFNDEEKDAIRDLYPTREVMDALQEQDIARFNNALEVSGVQVESASEPIISTFLAFDENLAIRRAAAELGLPEADLQLLIGKLSADLLDLGKGGTVQRQDFTATFAQSVCLLHLGRTRCCPVEPDMLEPFCEL